MYQAWRKVLGRTQMSGAGFIVPAVAGFDVAFNFRSTLGYVTDGAGQQFIGAASSSTYPTTNTINGTSVTYGWVITDRVVSASDESTGVDVRLAGTNYAEGTSGIATRPYFRVDIAAGTYAIHLSLGHPVTFATSGMYIEVTDTTTSKFTIGPASTAAGHVVDANATDMLTTDWPTSETARSVIFSTTQFRLHLASPTTADTTPMNHLRLVKTA